MIKRFIQALYVKILQHLLLETRNKALVKVIVDILPKKNLTRPLNSYRELEGWNVSSECFQNDSNVQAFTVDYVAAIFEKYLKTGKHGGITSNFDDKAYFQEVYRYNVDVWGFLTAYQDLIANIASSSYTAYRNSVICQLLSDVLFKYCYSPEYATKRIPIDQLADDLEKISFAAGVKKAPSRLAATKAKKIKRKWFLDKHLCCRRCCN